MLTKPTSGKKNPNPAGDAAGNARLLHDIETLSKALSLDAATKKKNNPHRSISAGKSHPPNPNPKPKPSSQKEKKPSFWNWKPLKALSHIRQRRIDCRFSLHVHYIDNVPSSLADSTLSVHWKRTTDSPSSTSSTRPIRVFNGIAEFEETLTHRCSVYGTRSGSSNSAKYEARHFLIYVSVVDFPGIDIGKHLVELTRLLPLTLEELEEEEKSSGNWSTSFRLSGKAKGASLNVSFGFSLVGDEPSGEKKVSVPKVGRVGSVVRARDRSRSVEDVKVLHEVLPSAISEASVLATVGGKMDFEKYGSGKLHSLEVDSRAEFEVFGQEDESPNLKSCMLPQPVKGDGEKECEEPEFTVIEQGIEIATKDQLCESKMENVESESEVGKVLATKDQLCESKMANVESESEVGKELATKDQLGEAKLEKIEFEPEGVDKGGRVGQEKVGEKPDEQVEESYHDSYVSEESSFLPEDPVIGDLDSAFQSISILESEGLESSHIEPKTPNQLSYAEVKSNYKAGGMKSKSLSLDDESVASEFLSMLGIEHSPFGLSSDSDPESPRERLWKQFEKESMMTNNGIFGLDIGAGKEPHWVDGDFAEDFDLSSIVHEAETELQKATQAMDSKLRAKMLEDAETEALMCQLGFNEKAFQCSPPGSRGGFGSPIDLPPEEPLELPPLGEGLGPFVQTKDGGFLRSMSPSLFRNAKNNGSLIMQVSSPVVVPAEMGSGIMEILQRLASVGIEKLSMQAKKLMPLEDFTGKTMQQIAWEAAPALEACERHDLLQHLKPEADSVVGQNASRRSKKGRSLNLSSSTGGEMSSEYVSLEDLAPLAMDKIEALSMEGLRIQSGMSDEEAPSNISPQSIGDVSALEGKGAVNSMSLGLEGTGGLQLLDVKDSGDDVDGLMGLSITLDEWMRLDSGIVDEEDHISDRTSKILAAHHARSTDMISGGWKGDTRGGKRSGRKWGLLGNNFTVALMVQLRDPLRNYEPVGTPMLSLIQVERVFVPPKPKIYSTVSEKGNSEQDDEPEMQTEPVAREEKKEEEDVVPQFKITEVHVAGLKTEPDKKKIWGNPMQQQSGSRWLLASGMGKSNKHPFMKSKAVSKPSPVTTKVQPGDTLWSISSRVNGNGAKWKELLALNPHIRNPNVIFPNETIRLR